MLAAILTAPAGATVQNYELNLAPYGSGTFAFDDVDIVWGADHAYSRRNASIGSSRAARRAGK